MKTKILLSGIALSLSVLTFAQEKPSLEQQIKEYSSRIESIVLAEKTKMNAELDAVDEKFKAGKISETEKQNQRNEIAARYETAINEKVEAEKSTLEEITKKSVKNSVMSAENTNFSLENSEENTNEKSEKKKHPKDKLKTSGFVLSLGWLNLTNSSEPYNFFKNDSETRFGQNVSYNYAIKGEFQIGKFTSPVFMSYGLGFRSDTHDLGRSRVFAQANDKLFVAPFSGGDLKRSQLRINYLEIPVDFNFVLNPKYIEHEGVKYLDASKKQIRVGVGIYGDLKVGEKIKYQYANSESRRNDFAQKVENGVNPFVFGAKLSAGYGGFNLFVKKDFTPLFNNSALLNNKLGLQFGIELAGLNF